MRALAPMRKPGEMGVSCADVNVSRRRLCRLGSLFTKQMVVGTAGGWRDLGVDLINSVPRDLEKLFRSLACDGM
jgi:hypothetical protein